MLHQATQMTYSSQATTTLSQLMTASYESITTPNQTSQRMVTLIQTNEMTITPTQMGTRQH